MRAIVNTGPDRLALKEIPAPEPAEGWVRVRTRACGICATDLEMISGWERTGFPSVPGHEWSGTIDSVGPGGDASLIGKNCVAENVLSDGGEVGFEHPGAYAQFLTTEAANVHLLPHDFPLTNAALIEPLAVCIRGINRLHEVIEPVIIFGDGPIGLLTLALLRHRGARDITLVGGREIGLALANEWGAARTVNYLETAETPEFGVRRTACAPFQTLIEASGNATAMQTAIQLAGHCGRILALGDYKTSRPTFLWNQLIHRELTLMGSNASAEAWPEAVQRATSGAIELCKLITHILPAERFEEGIELVKRHKNHTLKVVLDWDA